MLIISFSRTSINLLLSFYGFLFMRIFIDKSLFCLLLKTPGRFLWNLSIFIRDRLQHKYIWVFRAVTSRCFLAMLPSPSKPKRHSPGMWVGVLGCDPQSTGPETSNVLRKQFLASLIEEWSDTEKGRKPVQDGTLGGLLLWAAGSHSSFRLLEIV